MAYVYQVGQLYNPQRRQWPEATQYLYRGGRHELLLFFRQPSPAEVASARSGPVEFALFEQEDLLLLLYKITPGLGWSDAPYSWHLADPAERTVPQPAQTEAERDILFILLVDAGTGIIRVIRGVTFSPELTQALRSAIRRQAERPWIGRVAYDQQLDDLYARTTVDGLLRQATARSWGGE